MDVLNTFLIFNLTATLVVMSGFFLMRENVAATVENAKAKVAEFNMAGAAGAATSLMLLTSVAALFR